MDKKERPSSRGRAIMKELNERQRRLQNKELSLNVSEKKVESDIEQLVAESIASCPTNNSFSRPKPHVDSPIMLAGKWTFPKDSSPVVKLEGGSLDSCSTNSTIMEQEPQEEMSTEAREAIIAKEQAEKEEKKKRKEAVISSYQEKKNRRKPLSPRLQLHFPGFRIFNKPTFLAMARLNKKGKKSTKGKSTANESEMFTQTTLNKNDASDSLSLDDEIEDNMMNERQEQRMENDNDDDDNLI
ncbi:unnamed protein product [Dimorphilus gyrociliatus]|uniref:Uncharacterized protein n=1 Tax=Dimorphilus gyrociliatus TaxID=2664684 RepID=A0A7I8WBC8_9ANNE|nr:unnamed protein product [Dimorphilus gyrociliatus]